MHRLSSLIFFSTNLNCVISRSNVLRLVNDISNRAEKAKLLRKDRISLTDFF